MAEKFIIEGVGPKVPKWALDSTMRDIHDDIKNLVQVLQEQKSNSSGGSSKNRNLEQERAKYLRQLQETNKQHKQNNVRAKAFGNIIEENGESTEEALKDLSSSLLGTSKVSESSSKSLNFFKGILGKMASPVGIATSLFGILNLAIIGLTKYVRETITAFLDIYDTGLLFQKGLFDFRLAATEAALPLQEFSSLLMENSALIASFGLDGGRILGELSKSTRNLIFQQGQIGIGY